MNLTVLIPELGLFLGGIAVFLLSLTKTRTLALSTGILWLITASLFGISPAELFGKNYAWDGLSQYFSILILAATFFATLLGYLHPGPGRISYPKFVLLLFSLASVLIFLAGSQNLLYFLILGSIAQFMFYLLLREFDSQQAWHYLILDLVSSLVFLSGVGLLYAVSGALNLIDLKTNLVIDFFRFGVPGKILPVSLILITVALVYKLGSFPFYFWLGKFPKHQNLLPYSLFSLLIRLGFLAFAIRFWLRGVLIYGEDWQFILFIGGIGSILWGSLVLIIWPQKNRSWLYLDLVQVGFLICAISAPTLTSLSSGLFFLWSYFFSFWGLIFVFALFNKQSFDFVSLFSQIKSSKVALISSILFICSIVGLPFTAGFWGKYSLICGLFKEKMWGLAGAGLVSVPLLLFYFVVNLRKGLALKSADLPNRAPLVLRIGLLLCAAAILSVGFFPEIILQLVLEAAASIPF